MDGPDVRSDEKYTRCVCEYSTVESTNSYEFESSVSDREQTTVLTSDVSRAVS